MTSNERTPKTEFHSQRVEYREVTLWVNDGCTAGSLRMFAAELDRLGVTDRAELRHYCPDGLQWALQIRVNGREAS